MRNKIIVNVGTITHTLNFLIGTVQYYKHPNYLIGILVVLSNQKCYSGHLLIYSRNI